jgi:hypothetical protein
MLARTPAEAQRRTVGTPREKKDTERAFMRTSRNQDSVGKKPRKRIPDDGVSVQASGDKVGSIHISKLLN